MPGRKQMHAFFQDPTSIRWESHSPAHGSVRQSVPAAWNWHPWWDPARHPRTANLVPWSMPVWNKVPWVLQRRARVSFEAFRPSKYSTPQNVKVLNHRTGVARLSILQLSKRALLTYMFIYLSSSMALCKCFSISLTVPSDLYFTINRRPHGLAFCAWTDCLTCILQHLSAVFQPPLTHFSIKTLAAGLLAGVLPNPKPGQKCETCANLWLDFGIHSGRPQPEFSSRS